MGVGDWPIEVRWWRAGAGHYVGGLAVPGLGKDTIGSDEGTSVGRVEGPGALQLNSPTEIVTTPQDGQPISRSLSWSLIFWSFPLSGVSVPTFKNLQDFSTFRANRTRDRGAWYVCGRGVGRGVQDIGSKQGCGVGYDLDGVLVTLTEPILKRCDSRGQTITSRAGLSSPQFGL